MKKFLLFLTFCVSLFSPSLAQKAYVNSSPVTIVDGNNYTATGTYGSGYYQWVGVSGDGGTLFTTSFTSDLLFVNTNTDVTYDSLPIKPNDMLAISPDTMLILGTSKLYILQVSTKALDSIPFTGFQYRIEKRPGTNEVWVSADQQVHIFDYSGGNVSLVASFDISNHQYDNGELRFSSDGAYCYKLNQVSQNIVKIDANTHTVVDSVHASGNLFGIEMGTNDDHFYYSSSSLKKLYKVATATMDIIDSISTSEEVFNLFKYPTRDELWAVMHFDDRIMVYDINSLDVIDSIPTQGSPHWVAFVPGTSVDIEQIETLTQFEIYPNPADDFMIINLPEGVHTIELYECTGKLVMSKACNNKQDKIILDISNHKPGIYLLKIDGNTAQKVVIH